MQQLHQAAVQGGISRLPRSPCTCSRTLWPINSQWPSQARMPAAALCLPHQLAASTHFARSRRSACSASSSLPSRHIGQASSRQGLKCKQAAYQHGAALGMEGEHNGEGRAASPVGGAAPSREALKGLGAEWFGDALKRRFKPATKLAKGLYGKFISLLDFIFDCSAILPEFVVPSLSQALWRTGMVLAASLAMIIVISTIDSVWLYWYVLRARLGA